LSQFFCIKNRKINYYVGSIFYRSEKFRKKIQRVDSPNIFFINLFVKFVRFAPIYFLCPFNRATFLEKKTTGFFKKVEQLPMKIKSSRNDLNHKKITKINKKSIESMDKRKCSRVIPGRFIIRRVLCSCILVNIIRKEFWTK
jgi:hypothetical protein